MLVLGLQGSPRKGGNTDTFLAAFLEKAGQAGAVIKTVQVASAGIAPCKGCGYCEKHGTCVITDDTMAMEVYGLMRMADVIVAASPVFFYGISAQLKGLIDRSQTLWARKYVYKLKDPLASTRKGILFSVGASKGRQLFDGINLTTKYFFDAIDAKFSHSMTYRGIESKGAIRKDENFAADIDNAVETIISPLLARRRVLFVSEKGACRAPMAAALAQRQYGDYIQTDYASLSPESELAAPMITKMEQCRLDLTYRTPQQLEKVLMGTTPDLTVVIGEGIDKKAFPGKKRIRWPLAGVFTPDVEMMDQLHQKTKKFVDSLMQHLE